MKHEHVQAAIRRTGALAQELCEVQASIVGLYVERRATQIDMDKAAAAMRDAAAVLDGEGYTAKAAELRQRAEALAPA